MPEPGSFARRRNDTVLLVDDYADARATIRDLLEENGYPVVEAANGQQALNILVSQKASRIGLIVLDLQMPVMDGWEFLKVLRNYVLLSHMPVLVVSAHAKRLEAAACQHLVGCLQSPFDVTELLALVETSMQSPSGGKPVQSSG
jgi:two-component system, response regulator, stage 0 sporulation protein F